MPFLLAVAFFMSLWEFSTDVCNFSFQIYCIEGEIKNHSRLFFFMRMDFIFRDVKLSTLQVGRDIAVHESENLIWKFLVIVWKLEKLRLHKLLIDWIYILVRLKNLSHCEIAIRNEQNLVFHWNSFNMDSFCLDFKTKDFSEINSNFWKPLKFKTVFLLILHQLTKKL